MVNETVLLVLQTVQLWILKPLIANQLHHRKSAMHLVSPGMSYFYLIANYDYGVMFEGRGSNGLTPEGHIVAASSSKSKNKHHKWKITESSQPGRDSAQNVGALLFYDT